MSSKKPNVTVNSFTNNYLIVAKGTRISKWILLTMDSISTAAPDLPGNHFSHHGTKDNVSENDFCM